MRESKYLKFQSSLEVQTSISRDAPNPLLKNFAFLAQQFYIWRLITMSDPADHRAPLQAWDEPEVLVKIIDLVGVIDQAPPDWFCRYVLGIKSTVHPVAIPIDPVDGMRRDDLYGLLGISKAAPI